MNASPEPADYCEGKTEMQKALPSAATATGWSAWRTRQTPWIVVGLFLLFFAAPWGWENTARAVLHGLCAQTPSHTLRFGPYGLPFDSRMTGIYGGFLPTFVGLCAAARHRRARLPNRWTFAVLALLVVAMAVDGFNSLFLDLQLRHPYTPQNWLRLLTGVGTGVAIAVVMTFLVATSLWRRPDTARAAVAPRDLALLLAAQAPFVALALSGYWFLALPLTLILLASAMTAVSVIALVAIVLFRQWDGRYSNAWELDRLATVAIVIAAVVIGGLASGRFLLEHFLGLPPLS